MSLIFSIAGSIFNHNSQLGEITQWVHGRI